MREILFRGKALQGGEWQYGDYMSYAGGAQIWIHDPDGGTHNVLVDPATVGQYTGLKDKNGVKIFEGDIVQVENPKPFLPYIRPVAYEDTCFIWGDYILGEFDRPGRLEVIGNAIDNPELLEENP